MCVTMGPNSGLISYYYKVAMVILWYGMESGILGYRMVFTQMDHRFDIY